MAIMSWPYHFVDPTPEEIIERRVLLDRYGAYAQLSALVPVLAFQLYRLGIWVYSQRKKTEVRYTEISNAPTSPIRKQGRLSPRGALARRWRSAVWWLGGEVYPGWGVKGHWIAGLTWTSWLLFLTVNETGDDYMHVTKRFGHVAAAQFPFHYMLSMKSPHSPLAIAFRSSHEDLNTYHRISGRVLYCLLVMHAIFYLNFFAQRGILMSRLSHLVPFLGAFSIALLTLMAFTSLAIIRRWSYRIFFVLHLSIAISLMPALFFHASPLRIYTMEALALFVTDLVLRKLDTVTTMSKITSIEHTNLVKIASPMPKSKLGRFEVAPGQHVYLSIPPQTVHSKMPLLSIHQLLFNPFTVADVSPSGIQMVLRTLKGPTTGALRALTKPSVADAAVNIEGPYGASRRFPDFAVEFDRILLVAGGVGGTFILPIYHRIISEIKSDGLSASKIELIWAIRSLSEAEWVANTEYSKIMNADDRVKIYVTANKIESLNTVGEVAESDGSSVELDNLVEAQQPGKVPGGHTRPNLRDIVDNTFRHGLEERVAVLVCGPAEMAQELRDHVGRWVIQGRYVWWHDEAFGW